VCRPLNWMQNQSDFVTITMIITLQQYNTKTLYSNFVVPSNAYYEDRSDWPHPMWWIKEKQQRRFPSHNNYDTRIHAVNAVSKDSEWNECNQRRPSSRIDMYTAVRLVPTAHYTRTQPGLGRARDGKMIWLRYGYGFDAGLGINRSWVQLPVASLSSDCCTKMDDCLSTDKTSRYKTKHQGQQSFLFVTID